MKPEPHCRRPAALLTIAALALALTAACSGRPATPGATGSTAATTTPGSTPASAAPLATAPPVPSAESVAARTMPYPKRKATMPEGMPIEIPVIDGSVVTTSAPVSSNSWLYTIDTTGTIASVGDWYARAYANAGWRVRDYTPGEDTLRITFVKHAANTQLTVTRVSSGHIRVRASIGLGEQPPQTN